MNNEEFLTKLCEIGAKEKGIDLSSSKYGDRYKHELSVIKKGNLFDYFLIVHDIIREANERDILVGIGRGSAGGSLVCYLLGITGLDPLQYELLFERFLSEARFSAGAGAADVDMDFQASRKPEITQYIRDKYGEDCTAAIPTLSRMGIKSGLRSLARIEEVPVAEVDRVAKKVPDNLTVEEALMIPEVDAFCSKYPRIGRLFPQIVNTIYFRGIHAAGMIITPGPISDYLSMERVSGTDCVCFDKDVLEEMGFLKMDILGIKTLDVIKDSLSMIGEGKDFLPESYSDENVFSNIFIPGDLLGVFQFETQNLTEIAKKVKIDTFDKIYDTTSIARPGPLHSGEADKYIKRRNGLEETTFLHKSLEPILSKTYGIIIYQEQVMQIVNQVAGLPLSDAEKVRKLVAKSKGLEALDKFKEKFIDGAINNDVNEETSNEIWKIIRESGAYSFPKAHGVAYSVMSYWCAWLKNYYRQEFLTSLMRHETGETMSQAIIELREAGVEVRSPDINKSEGRSIITEDGATLIGLSDVDQVGDAALSSIMENRPFESFDDFYHRRDTKNVNIRVIRNLIQAGAFDEFGRRDELFYYVTPNEVPENGDIPVWEDKEMYIRQMNVLDMPPEIPLISYFDDPFDVELTEAIHIDWEDPQDEIFVKGIITNVKKKVGYSFFNINDGSGLVNVLASEEVLEQYEDVFASGIGTPVLVKGHMVEGRTRLYADIVLPLENYDKYRNAIKYLENGRKDELEFYKNGTRNHVDIVISSNYFKSKRGNRGTRLLFSDGSRLMCFDEKVYPVMAGDILEYKVSKDPFINVEKVL